VCCLDSHDVITLITTCTDYEYFNIQSNQSNQSNGGMSGGGSGGGLGLDSSTCTANNIRSVTVTIPASHTSGVSV